MNTKAEVGAPPSRRRTGSLGDIAARPLEPANNMTDQVFKDLSFRVDLDWHRRFKTAASHYNVSMKRVLEEGFELWLAEQERKNK